VQYAAKRAYQSVIVSGYIYPIQSGLEAQLGVYVVSDEMMAISGTLVIEVVNWKTGAILNNSTFPFSVAALQSTRVFNTTVGKVIASLCSTLSDCYVHVIAAVADDAIATTDTIVYLSYLKEVQLSQPHYTIMTTDSPTEVSSTTPTRKRLVSIESTTENLLGRSSLSGSIASSASLQRSSSPLVQSIMVSISCDFPSPYTWLEVSIPGYWSDNAFFLQAHQSLSVTFFGYDSFDPQEFKQQLLVRNVYDTYHRDEVGDEKRRANTV